MPRGIIPEPNRAIDSPLRRRPPRCRRSWTTRRITCTSRTSRAGSPSSADSLALLAGIRRHHRGDRLDRLRRVRRRARRPASAQELEVMRTGESIVGLEEKEVWLDGHISWVLDDEGGAVRPRAQRVGRASSARRARHPRRARKLMEAREHAAGRDGARHARRRARAALARATSSTGLFNRRGFEQLGEAAIGAARQRVHRDLRALRRTWSGSQGAITRPLRSRRGRSRADPTWRRRCGPPCARPTSSGGSGATSSRR